MRAAELLAAGSNFLLLHEVRMHCCARAINAPHLIKIDFSAIGRDASLLSLWRVVRYTILCAPSERFKRIRRFGQIDGFYVQYLLYFGFSKKKMMMRMVRRCCAEIITSQKVYFIDNILI